MVRNLKFFDPTQTSLSYYVPPGSNVTKKETANFFHSLVVHSVDSGSKQTFPYAAFVVWFL